MHSQNSRGPSEKLFSRLFRLTEGADECPCALRQKPALDSVGEGAFGWPNSSFNEWPPDVL